MRCARRIGSLTLLFLVLAVAPARADLPGTMTSELLANGVPHAVVTVATPAAATASDAAAFESDPSADGASLTPYNLLSPDPTAPLPVATVTFGPSSTTLLPGVITPPSQPGVYVEDSQTPIWDLTIMEAMKHAIGRGTSAGCTTDPCLTGVALQPAFPAAAGVSIARDSSQPDVYVGTPAASDFSAAPLLQTMPSAAIQLQYQLGLPQQYAGATVSVADQPAGGQRIVTIEYDQQASAFATDDLSALIDYADTEQSSLNDPLQGGNIGEVVVISKDSDPTSPTFGQALFTHAADSAWGQKFEWAAPGIKAFVDQSPTDPSSRSSRCRDRVRGAHRGGSWVGFSPSDVPWRERRDRLRGNHEPDLLHQPRRWARASADAEAPCRHTAQLLGRRSPNRGLGLRSREPSQPDHLDEFGRQPPTAADRLSPGRRRARILPER